MMSRPPEMAVSTPLHVFASLTDGASRCTIPILSSGRVTKTTFASAIRFIRAYGFSANFKEFDSTDTASPFHAPVVLKLPLKYGFKESEYRRRWAFARTNAFAAKAGRVKIGFAPPPPSPLFC